jgi:hypothetical protein
MKLPWSKPVSQHKFHVGQLVRIIKSTDKPQLIGEIVSIVALPGCCPELPNSYKIDLYYYGHTNWYGEEHALQALGEPDHNTVTTWDKVKLWRPKTTKTPAPV